MNISCAATDLRPSGTWWHQSPMFNVHRILMLARYFHTVYCSYNATKEGFGWEAFYVVGMSVWLSRRFLEIGEFESKCKVAILSVLFFNCRKYKYFSNFGSWERCKCVNNEYFISFKSEYYQQIKAIIFDSIYYIQYMLWCKFAAGDSFKSQRWITESFMSAPRRPSLQTSSQTFCTVSKWSNEDFLHDEKSRPGLMMPQENFIRPSLTWQNFLACGLSCKIS